MSDHVAPKHSRVGILTTTPLDGGPSVTVDLVCCKHCGFMWEYRPGSGKTRGFCTACNGLVCGRPSCRARPCQHWMHGIDNLEAGRPEATPKRILVVNPGTVG